MIARGGGVRRQPEGTSCLKTGQGGRPIVDSKRRRRAAREPQAGPGEGVTFMLPAEKLAYYDVGRHGFVVEPGMFDVMVGSSSADIRARGQMEVGALKYVDWSLRSLRARTNAVSAMTKKGAAGSCATVRFWWCMRPYL